MSVLQFPTAPATTESIERLWSAYVEAAERAQRTRHISDAMAAGRAWARFLKEFAE